jgi:hypothetical protein
MECPEMPMRISMAPSSRTLALVIALAALLAGSLVPAAGAQPTLGGQPVRPGEPAQPRDALTPRVLPAASQPDPPPGYVVRARDALRTADAQEKVRDARAEHPGMRGEAYVPLYFKNASPRWQVTYLDGEDQVAEVIVDGRTGAALETWDGPQVDWLIARGYKPSMGRAVNEPWIWIALSVLFVAPFFDPRRPFRLLHLDLLVLLSFGVSLALFNNGNLDASVPLVYPALGYLLVRMLVAGFRPRERRERLVPLVPAAVLIAGVVLLAAFRIGLNVVDSEVIDVGYAGVVGADRISVGEELYVDNEVHGDAYGPFNYVAYYPFEQLLPWSGAWDDLPAAHGAAIAFDLLTILGLFLLGRRLRPGREGRLLGLALAYAWTAYPFTAYVLGANTNDALVAMLMVYALLALSSPPARGALLALGAAAKFVPLALAPLFAAGTGDRRPRPIVVFAAVFAAICALTVVLYLPPGGPREFWDTTIGYQLGRESVFSPWGLWESLEPLQTILKAGAAALAIAVAFVPRRRTPVQVAALGAAVIIALQLAAMHWFYFYLVWFAPFLLAALFGAHRSPGPPEVEPAVEGRAEESRLQPATA